MRKIFFSKKKVVQSKIFSAGKRKIINSLTMYKRKPKSTTGMVMTD